MSIKIVLADDQAIVREGLRSMLESQSEVQVVAQTGYGDEVAKLVKKMSPDVVISEVLCKYRDATESVQKLVSQSPNTRVVILSTQIARRYIVGLLAAGASGYLTKNSSFAELVHAIRTVVGGRTYLSPQVSDIVVKSYFQNKNNASHHLLSPRERQVLQLLVQGYSAKEVASECSISLKTVETHRFNLMRKLNITSTVELVKYAIREGITSVD